MVNPNPTPNISIIVAVAQNYAIGKDNDLLWHLSDDLKRFKALTSGHAVIMGRRTFDSLPRRPLPNRRNIVLTHDESFSCPGVEVAHTIAQALALIADEEETFVMGGATLYSQFLPFTQKMYVTWVYQDYSADVFFPTIDGSVFRLVSSSEKQFDNAAQLFYSYAEYQRIPLR